MSKAEAISPYAVEESTASQSSCTGASNKTYHTMPISNTGNANFYTTHMKWRITMPNSPSQCSLPTWHTQPSPPVLAAAISMFLMWSNELRCMTSFQHHCQLVNLIPAVLACKSIFSYSRIGESANLLFGKSGKTTGIHKLPKQVSIPKLLVTVRSAAHLLKYLQLGIHYKKSCICCYIVTVT